MPLAGQAVFLLERPVKLPDVGVRLDRRATSFDPVSAVCALQVEQDNGRERAYGRDGTAMREADKGKYSPPTPTPALAKGRSERPQPAETPRNKKAHPEGAPLGQMAGGTRSPYAFSQKKAARRSGSTSGLGAGISIGGAELASISYRVSTMRSMAIILCRFLELNEFTPFAPRWPVLADFPHAGADALPLAVSIITSSFSVHAEPRPATVDGAGPRQVDA